MTLTTQPNEAIAVATIDQARLTSTTCVVVYDRLDADTIARLKLVRDAFSDLFNHAAELVTERYGHTFASDGMWRCGTD